MILIDTSAWIEYFRNGVCHSPRSAPIAVHQSERVVICEPVAMRSLFDDRHARL